MPSDSITKKERHATDGGVLKLENRGRRLVTGALLLCCPAALQAADWSFDPVARLTMGYDTNAALKTVPHDATSYVTFFPGLTIWRTTETSAVNLGLLARATSYAESEFENTHEERITLSSFVQTTERTKLGLNALSLWDTLFESTVIDSGTDNSGDVDIGLVTTKVSRNRREVRPSVVYALTERGSVEFRYRQTDVLFDDVGTTGLVEYQQHFLSGIYSYRLTDTNDMQVVVQGAQFRPVEGTESDTTALLAGITHKFSETAKVGFQAGVGKSTATRDDGSQVDTDTFVLEARAYQLSELSRLDALISRNIQPSGSGSSVSSNQLRVSWDPRLSSTTRLRVRTKVFRNQTLEGAVNSADRRYAEAQVGLRWYWAPEWSVGVDYKYRSQKYDAQEDSAQSSGVSATLAWAPPRRK